MIDRGGARSYPRGVLSRRSLALALLLSAPAALADKATDKAPDKIAALSQALLGDPSFRVKVQAAIVLGKLGDRRGGAALARALKDENEAVRAVAAGALGKLGDRAALGPLREAMDDQAMTVRSAAGKAIASLERAPAGGGAGPSPEGKFFFAVASIAPGQGGPECAKRVRDKVTARLAELERVTLSEGEPARARYVLDGNITNLSTTAPDASGRVRTDCDLRLVLATKGERAIKMMASVGGSVDGTNDPKDIAAARAFCLDDAASQAVLKVQTFLETL